MKNYASLCVAPAVLCLMVACGGGGGESTTSTATSSTPEPAAAAAPAGDVGGLEGVIAYANGDPDIAIQMGADPVCQSLHTEPVETEKIVGAEGKLANVFVYVKSGLSGSYPAPSESHLLNQQGCKYTPHVSGMMVGQNLVIKNSDPTLHNVHAIPTANPEFNQGQPFQDMELEKTFEQVEVMVPFKCDVHPWMQSYIAVLDHPFFGVSDNDGGFSIFELPVGTYTLEAWHAELGTQTQEVTITANGVSEVSFDFSPAAG